MSSKDKNVTSEAKTKQKKPVSKVLIMIGSVIILIFAAISFIFIPALVQGTGASGAYKAFGSYKNQSIEWTENSTFANMINYRLQEAEQNGQVLDNISYYQILETAFADTVTRMAFSEMVEKSGYIVPDTAVNRVLRQYFVDETGEYSQKVYNQASDAVKIQMRKQVEEDLVYQQFFNDFFNTNMQGSTVFGLKTSTKESDFIYNMSNSQRSLNYAAFAMHDYPDEEIEKYGKANASLFESIDMSVITVASKSEAEKVLTRIKNNEITFEDAIQEYSNKNFSDDAGKLASTYSYQLKTTVSSDESYHALLIQGTTEVSDVIQTGAFYSIFKANKAPAAANFTQKETLDAVFDYIANNDAGIVEDYFNTKAENFATAASVTSFDDACAKYGVTKKTTKAFPLNYNNNSLILESFPTENEEIAQGYANETFLKAAFGLKGKEISSPIIMGNYVVVMQIAEEKTMDNSVEGMKEYFTMYYQPVYSSMFDQSSAAQALLSSDDVTNNVLSVYLEQMLANN